MIKFQEFIDLQESSKPEKSSGRLSFGRAENKMTKAERIATSAAKRAGFKGGGARHTSDWRSRGKFHSTYPYDKYGDDFKHPKSNTQVDTEINTISSGRKAAVLDAGNAKRKNKIKPDGRRAKVVAPTKELVRKMKEFRRRVVKSGGQERNPVHKVDFIHRADENPEKNKLDKTAFKRGRNFYKAIDKISSELKKSGAKKGDVVIGKPAAMMSGEDTKKGKEAREKLYLRKFKSRNAKGTDKTGRVSPGVIGSVQEERTFNQFIAEAKKRIHMVRVHHGTSASNAEKINKSGFGGDEVHASTSSGIAKSFGKRKGEDTRIIRMNVPKKDVKSDAPTKVLKTQGQRATDDYGREHYSVIMSPDYASKKISKETPVIPAPRLGKKFKKYQDRMPKAFQKRTKTAPKK
jgi:hypothetical protein